MSWIYNSEPVTTPPKGSYGFCYIITNLNSGRQYVGRKALTLKRGKKRVPSTWESYWGSCEELLEDVKVLGEAAFKREILHWCAGKGELNYREAEEQFARNVLHATMPDGSRAFYNGNILCRWYAPKKKV